MSNRQAVAWRVVMIMLLAWLLSAAAALLAVKSASVQLATIVAAGVASAVVILAHFALAQPRARLIRAIRDGILQLKDEDFSFGVARTGDSELNELATAFNSLVDSLRKQRINLYQRELLLDAMLQTTPMAMLLTDPSNRVIYANIAARDFFAVEQKLEGMGLRDLLERIPEAARAALAAGNDGLFTIQRDTEAQVWHLSGRSFVLNARPHRVMLLKQLTRELTSQELAIWKKMMRLLAHELNNSLAPMSSLARSGRALIAGPKAPELERIFSTIESRAEHLASFIDGYARFARLPRPRPQLLHWQQYLDPLGDALNCRIDLEDATLMGTFDPSQLEQVLINLVKNAHESGSSPEEIRIAVRELPQTFAIEVSDRGEGLPEETLKNALLPFFSTKPSGSGLGLTLCREIAHAHGGHLTIANRPDGGAVVTIFLPKTPPV